MSNTIALSLLHMVSLSIDRRKKLKRRRRWDSTGTCDSDRITVFQGRQVKREGKCFLLVFCAWTRRLRSRWHTRHLSPRRSICVPSWREKGREMMFIYSSVVKFVAWKARKKKKKTKEWVNRVSRSVALCPQFDTTASCHHIWSPEWKVLTLWHAVS